MNLILDDNCPGAYGEGAAKQLVSEFNLSVVISTSFKSLTTPSTTVLPISTHSKAPAPYQAYSTTHTYSTSFIYILAIVGDPEGGNRVAGSRRPTRNTMSILSAPSRPVAARGLGDHKHSSTSMGTITLMAQSADPSATSTPNLFPTTTAGRSDPGTGGPGSANVYYLVVCPFISIVSDKN
jgi:hypothetical protein